MSVGSSLKEMRKSAGFTVDQLSARTRIPTSVIEDLERDNFSTCGGPTYARGHIRTIARICGVGDSEVLLAFESQTIPLSKSIRDLLNDTNATAAKKERKPLSWKALGELQLVYLLLRFSELDFFQVEKTIQQQLPPHQIRRQVKIRQQLQGRNGVEVTLKGVNGLSWVAISDSTGTTQFSGRIRQEKSAHSLIINFSMLSLEMQERST